MVPTTEHEPYTLGMTIPIEQAQAELARLVDKVLAGEEMAITRDGKVVARIVPSPAAVEPPKGDRVPGSAKGQIWIAPDFDEPLEEFREYM